MAAKRSTLWFGYLEAGEKTSPVVRDDSLSTGRNSTVYLFNLNKGRILEYRRDIVGSKLRDLNDEESAMVASLRLAFDQAREGFQPRGSMKPPQPPRMPKKAPQPEEEDLVFEDDRAMAFIDDDS
jgi:hypothetical protein